MKIELLYIEGCPTYLKAVEMVRTVLQELEVTDTKVHQVLVKSFAQAEELQFLGSPTIRVNGKDIDPEAGRKGVEYELACRVYHVRDRTGGLPDIKWVKDALKAAKKEDEEKAERSKKGGGRSKYGAKPLPKPKGVKTFTEAKKEKRAKKMEK